MYTSIRASDEIIPADAIEPHDVRDALTHVGSGELQMQLLLRVEWDRNGVGFNYTGVVERETWSRSYKYIKN